MGGLGKVVFGVLCILYFSLQVNCSSVYSTYRPAVKFIRNSREPELKIINFKILIRALSAKFEYVFISEILA